MPYACCVRCGMFRVRNLGVSLGSFTREYSEEFVSAIWDRGRLALGTRQTICGSAQGPHERTKKKPSYSGKHTPRDSIK